MEGPFQILKVVRSSGVTDPDLVNMDLLEDDGPGAMARMLGGDGGRALGISDGDGGGVLRAYGLSIGRPSTWQP